MCRCSYKSFGLAEEHKRHNTQRHPPRRRRRARWVTYALLRGAFGTTTSTSDAGTAPGGYDDDDDDEGGGGGRGRALRVCTYPSTGWMSSSPPGGTAAFADARDDRGTTIPTLPPSPLPRTTTTTTCGGRDSGCWLELRVAYARYYDAMTIADDVDDDAKHRRREDESSSSAENVRTTMAPHEASGERIVASKALDWGG